MRPEGEGPVQGQMQGQLQGQLQGMPALTLVVATLGREAELERLCTSLNAQTCQDFDVVVVDQNTDARAQRAMAGFARPAALHLERISGRGAALARNVGLRLARGGWVAFPDDDCWYAPDTVAAALEATRARPAPDALVGHWTQLGPPPPAGSLDAQRFARLRGPTASMITQFYRRACLEAAGGFDERFGPPAWHAGSEETDLLLRVLRSGARVVACPGVRVHHPVFTPGAEGARAAYRRVVGRARGTGALYAKHRLEAHVVARGLLLPWLRALGNVHRPAQAARQLALGVGRAQGWWTWQRRYPRDPAHPAAA